MTELCSIDELAEGQALGFDLPNKPVFAVRKDGEIFVYQNECPHLGVTLEFNENDFLDSDGELIQCSTHGALFEINSGYCISGPCQGEHLKPVPFNIVNNRLHLL